MAITATNKGTFRLSQTAVASLTLGAVAFSGTVPDEATIRDLNTVADLDALTGITLGTERVTVSSATATEDDTNNRVNVDTSDIVFAADAGFTASGHAIYHQTAAADASREILFIQDTGYPKDLTGGLTIAVVDLFRLVPQTA